MLTIRHATPADARPLAQLAEETFRATFGAMNTAVDMDLHCQTSYSEALQAREIAQPNMLTLLCEQSGQLIGFAQLRWAETPSCVSGKTPGEIQRFYLAHAWHGQGIAQKMMSACLAEMGQHGSDVVWLGVWEHNPRAIAFYEKFGFTAVGDHIFPLGHDPQRDIIMVRSIRIVKLNLDIRLGDLGDPLVQTLLQEHLNSMAEHSPPESIHALPIAKLAASDISFWCGWHGLELAGCGALKELSSTHGEIKTMRTAAAYLHQGVATQLLQHIMGEAERRGYQSLSLETGSADAFLPARRLYQKFGFEYCEPFGNYKADPFSIFMTKRLA